MRYRFSDFVLDCHLFELRRGGVRVEIQPKVFSFIRLMADNARRTLSKDEIFGALWPDVIVADASLQRIASLARRAVSRSGGDELISTVRGIGYRLDADVEKETPGPKGAEPEPPASERSTENGERLTQEIRFCKTVDGLNIAWAKIGNGTPLLRSLGWFSNLEMEWEWEAGRRFWERLARRHALVRYDGRGIGMSDPTDDFSLETRLRDMEAVVEDAGIERFALLGMSEGCSAAIKYASRHPDRVSHLVLCGAPETTVGRMSQERWEWGQAYFGVLGQAWGGDSARFERFLASLYLGDDATPEMLDYFTRMQRASADKETALTYTTSIPNLNVAEEAAGLNVPTLVLHRRDDELCPLDGGRAVAAAIPGARFMLMDGSNHWLLLDDPKADSVIEALEQFLSK